MKPLIDRSAVWLIVVSMVSKRILEGILGIWLSSRMSGSLAFFVVYALFAVYLIYRKRASIRGIHYLAVMTIFVSFSAMLAIGLYYVPETRLPIWVTFVVFSLVIVSLVRNIARIKARPAGES